MNRRSFMKAVGGALAGVVALALPNENKKISGTRALTKEEVISLQKAAFPMYKFDPNFGPNIANIDSNSEWAKECKKLTDDLIKRLASKPPFKVPKRIFYEDLI